MKKVIAGGVCLLSGVLFSCTSKNTSTDTARIVKIDTIRYSDAHSLLVFPGRVKAEEDISLAFKVGGRIGKMYVDEGSYIQKGQLIAELDPTDYQAQLNATEAEYKRISAEAERVIALYKDEVATANDYDKARYGLEQITVKRNYAREQMGYTRLYAPFSGYIQKRLFQPHETVSAGMPVYAVVSKGLPEIEINLPASVYVRREQFKGYTCTFDLYPHHTYPLTLVSISPKANANQLYTMHLRMTQTADAPMPSLGMNASVSIRMDSVATPSLSVPTSALLSKDDASYIYIYQPKDQTVQQRAVHVHRLTEDGRAIISGEGIAAGIPVVGAGVHHVKNGEQVKPLAPVTKTNVGGLL